MRTGTFEPWTTAQVGNIPERLIAADFNGDSFADIEILHSPNVGQTCLTVLYNDRTGHFPTRSEYSSAQVAVAYAMTAGDFDGDGRLDLALADPQTRSAQVFLN